MVTGFIDKYVLGTGDLKKKKIRNQADLEDLEKGHEEQNKTGLTGKGLDRDEILPTGGGLRGM